MDPSGRRRRRDSRRDRRPRGLAGGARDPRAEAIPPLSNHSPLKTDKTSAAESAMPDVAPSTKPVTSVPRRSTHLVGRSPSIPQLCQYKATLGKSAGTGGVARVPRSETTPAAARERRSPKPASDPERRRTSIGHLPPRGLTRRKGAGERWTIVVRAGQRGPPSPAIGPPRSPLLITRRSQVQILPPPPTARPGNSTFPGLLRSRRDSRVYRVFYRFGRPSGGSCLSDGSVAWSF